MYTLADIKAIVSNVLECSAEEILDNTPLADLGYDSLKFINIVVDIESKYNIEILDSDLIPDNFKDVLSINKTLKKYFDDKVVPYKCIITDCDGVLWRGIAGESGRDRAYMDEITNGFCDLLRSLRQKGVLLAICSKNEFKNINAMIKSTSICIDDFAVVQSNASSKFDSVWHILREFGFNADSAIYIDDSDAELEYVKSKVPELTVIKADFQGAFLQNIDKVFASLPDMGIIDRTAKFREQKEREKYHKGTSSPKEYNQLLKTNIICEKAILKDAHRLSELSQRANRFNLTGAKYTINDLKYMQSNNTYIIYKLTANDKFGDMGIVAMAVVHGKVIESFIMSCRVFGRGFEIELLNKIKEDCGSEIEGVYLPTGRNDYCKRFYEEQGVPYVLY